MKKSCTGIGTGSSGFTLVELLVVITILAIISVVAYTQFGGVTDKAKNSSKIDQLTSVEGALNMFNSQNNYFPMPAAYDANTNVWGYNYTTPQSATKTATFTGTKNTDQILTVTSASIVGGGKILLSGTQIGAKGVIDGSVLSKQYLSQELSDPALKDIKVGTDKVFKDFGLGKYIYGVYTKMGDFTQASKRGSAYSIAATLQDDQKGSVAKVLGNFDKSTCPGCPDSLITDGTTSITDGLSYTGSEANNSNLNIPYPIIGF